MFDHPATMIEDLTYGTLPDSRFPERGFIGPGLNFKHKYRLPMGVYGDKVLLQWRYVTANNCIPEGYRDNADWVKRGWGAITKPDCPPLNLTGEENPTEQFFSCAEISINRGAPSPPTAPTTPTAPSPPSPPTTSNNCGGGNRGNGKCSNPRDCCSEFGWCGRSNDHCGGSTMPGIYYIKSAQWNTYLRMHPHGEVDMADKPLGWEQFFIQSIGGGKYALKSNYHGNKYINVVGPGEGKDVMYQVFVAEWETFYIESLGGGLVAFRNAHFNNYVRALGPGTSANVDSQTFPGPWERFILIPIVTCGI